MKTFRKVSAALECLHQLIHLLFRVAAHNGELRGIEIQQTTHNFHFVSRFYFIIILGHLRNRQFLLYDLNHLRVLLELLGDLGDRVRHCRGEHYGLALLRKLTEDRLHVLEESHVQHLVRLIENHRVDRVGADRLSSHMIHHTSRGSNDDLDTAL